MQLIPSSPEPPLLLYYSWKSGWRAGEYAFLWVGGKLFIWGEGYAMVRLAFWKDEDLMKQTLTSFPTIWQRDGAGSGREGREPLASFTSSCFIPVSQGWILYLLRFKSSFFIYLSIYFLFILYYILKAHLLLKIPRVLVLSFSIPSKAKQVLFLYFNMINK